MKGLILCIVVSFVLTACLPATPSPTATPQPTFTPQPSPTAVLTTSEEFVSRAWKAYEQNEFDLAIELAQECVDRWEGQAIEQQTALVEAPPNGVVSDADKKAIFANWALNDVGTAYFIIGESLAKQGKFTEATAAYEQAEIFSYARAWDPQGGWFWAPAEEAGNRLVKMP